MFTLQYGGVVKRQLVIPTVLVVEHIDFFSLGIIGQSASLAYCLEDGHAIRELERALPFNRPGQVDFLAVDLGNNDGHVRRANDLAELLLNDGFYLRGGQDLRLATSLINGIEILPSVRTVATGTEAVGSPQTEI